MGEQTRASRVQIPTSAPKSGTKNQKCKIKSMAFPPQKCPFRISQLNITERYNNILMKFNCVIKVSISEINTNYAETSDFYH